MNFDLKAPCKDCPFKNNVAHQRGWLGKSRAESIIHAITEEDKTFQCHKTLDLASESAQHCAGATILLERLDNPNQWMRIAERINFYDRNKLVMDSPVFDTPEQFIKWHSGEHVVTSYQKRALLAQAKDSLIEGYTTHDHGDNWAEVKKDQMQNFLENLKQKGIKPEVFKGESSNA